MRWKALQFDGKLNPSEKKTYGLHSQHPSLWTLVRNVEFRFVSNDLQDKMKNDIHEIRQSGKVIAAADKSSNLYKLDHTDYEKLLKNSITATYKKTDIEHFLSINKAGRKIAEKLELADRMERLQKSEPYHHQGP